MRKHQRGMTMIGFLVLMVPVAIVVYAGIRLTPVYLNYMRVAHCLDQVGAEVDGQTATTDAIRNALGKHFDIDSIEYPEVKDIKVTRTGHTWLMEADYDEQAPLFANLSILVTFDKRVLLKSAVGE